MVQKIADENKVQFINENIHMVPKNQMKKFQTLDIDGQVDKIQFYFDMQKMKDEWKEKNRMVNRVKDLFEKRHGTVEDAKDIMRYMQDFIDTAKEREIAEIDRQIAELEERKLNIK